MAALVIRRDLSPQWKTSVREMAGRNQFPCIGRCWISVVKNSCIDRLPCFLVTSFYTFVYVDRERLVLLKATARRFESFPAFHTRRSFTTPLHKSHAATANGYLGAANYLECSRFDVECRPKRRYHACRRAFHSPDKSRREDFAPLETPPMNERILCFIHRAARVNLAVARKYPDTWCNLIKRLISLSHFQAYGNCIRNVGYPAACEIVPRSTLKRLITR